MLCAGADLELADGALRDAAASFEQVLSLHDPSNIRARGNYGEQLAARLAECVAWLVAWLAGWVAAPASVLGLGLGDGLQSSWLLGSCLPWSSVSFLLVMRLPCWESWRMPALYRMVCSLA